jgi:class 3 adenylate cyclase/CHASE2 domain-containing sensor protein
VKLKPFKIAPVLIAFGVIAFFCLIQFLEFSFRSRPGDQKAGLDFFGRLENVTYDMRVRAAARHSPVVATNLGFVFINEDSLKAVWNNSLGYSYGLLWPRQVYGRLVEELHDQGAKAVGLDVIFSELRPDHPQVVMADGSGMESDEFFAMQMRRTSNVVIAITKDAAPPTLFLTNAWAVGHITTDKDADGILRRVQAFWLYTNWNFAFHLAEAQFGADLKASRVQADKITLSLPESNHVDVPLDKDGNFDWTNFLPKVPRGHAQKEKPYVLKPAWHMGIVLAARDLGLDLDNAVVDLKGGRIVLRGAASVERIIPVDEDGYFYVDWCIPPESRQLTKEAIESLLLENKMRLDGKTDGITNRWKDRLVVVGSSAVIGNNLTDRGATPLDKDTLLVSKHWNVANTILTGRFIRPAPLWLCMCLIAFIGIVTAWLTWQLRVLAASGLVALLIVAYIVFGFVLFVKTRYWIPLVLPVTGGFLMSHVCLVTWRLLFEQADKRRIRSIFSRVVSPKIVHKLISTEKLTLGGERREITVLFADIRGFTAFTDLSQERVAKYVRENKLTGADAEHCYDETARETLATVNLYLGIIADVIKAHDGTLDKFIGDCVMAFWGAPAADEKHAAQCVRAAIDAQRAMYEFNQKRAEENNRLQLENLALVAAGKPPKPMQPILLLGTGINTGMATAGLMGSTQAEFSYTVFGREVNLASRLEGASGRGRIFIGTTTYEHLKRDDPELAATCVEQPGLKLKGISGSVIVYEVPWRPPGASPLDEEFSTTAPSEGTTFTGFVQRGGT